MRIDRGTCDSFLGVDWGREFRGVVGTDGETDTPRDDVRVSSRTEEEVPFRVE